MLLKVARVDPSVIEAIRDRASNTDGYVAGLVDEINHRLGESLDLSRWWTQDPDIEIRVRPDGQDLIFTVRDRTASEYLLSERSTGLAYFVSYLVQYLADIRDGGTGTILLMDEPDATLSATGQQDLLRLFRDFVDRRDETRQVVYVTHSPFLIDKNRPRSVQVLAKGSDDEGTRVVSAGHGRYEPVRSALGGHLGETAFMGNCNILVEGASDKILLAASATFLRQIGHDPVRVLDLNHVTLIDCQGARNMRYVTEVARGKQHHKPPVVALFDGDDEGLESRNEVLAGTDLGAEDLVAIGHSPLDALSGGGHDGPLEIEDLVPIDLLVTAMADVAGTLGLDLDRDTLAKAATASDAGSHVLRLRAALDAVENPNVEGGKPFVVDKVPLADAVARRLATGEIPPSPFETNFAAVHGALRSAQERAEYRERSRQTKHHIRRIVERMHRELDAQSTRSQVARFITELRRLGDSSEGGRRLLDELTLIESEFALNTKPATIIDDIGALRLAIDRISPRYLDDAGGAPAAP